LVDAIFDFDFQRFLEGSGSSGEFGGGGGRDLETKVYGIGRQETFFNSVGGFESENIDTIYYVVYQSLAVISMRFGQKS